MYANLREVSNSNACKSNELYFHWLHHYLEVNLSTPRLSCTLKFREIVKAAALIPNLYCGLLRYVSRHRQNVDTEGFYCSEHNLFPYNFLSVKF